MKDYNEMAESVFERRDRYDAERRMAMNKLRKGMGGAVAVCLCLAAAGVWHSDIGTPTLPPAVGGQVDEADIPNNTMDANNGDTGHVDAAIWLSADEVVQSAENDTQMGVAVPIFVAYQGAIYCNKGEAEEGAQYALLGHEILFGKDYSYPAYQIKDSSDRVAIAINGGLTIYQKLFEVDPVVDGTPYQVVHPMGMGNAYSYGEIVQENEEFTVYQAIERESGEVMEGGYIIDLLPLCKRELPTLFGGNENYGDAWWLAVPRSND